MKPKRPTETDLLPVVQNGFQDQLSRDQGPKESHGKSCPPPTQETPRPPVPAALVRITLVIPEDLRYRIKLAVMDLRRKSQPRLTQDEFCTEALHLHLHLHLEKREGETRTVENLARTCTFLKACIQTKEFNRSLAAEAATLLGIIERGLGWDQRPAQK